MLFFSGDKPLYIHVETFSNMFLYNLSKFRFYKENIKYRNINIKYSLLSLENILRMQFISKDFLVITLLKKKQLQLRRTEKRGFQYRLCNTSQLL